jgi:hypothetical protein
MGSSGSRLPLTPDQPAPDGKGTCVLSQTFKEAGLPDDYDKFWPEMIRVIKVPHELATEGPWMKSFENPETKTDGGIDFTVKIVLDKEKLKDIPGVGEMKNDVVKKYSEYSFNIEDRTLIEKAYQQHEVGSEPKLMLTSVVSFLEPLQIMLYWELPDGTRFGNQDTANALMPYTERIATRILTRTIKLTLDEGKKAVLSGPIDEEVIAGDAFFDKYERFVKEDPRSLSIALPGMTIASTEETDGATVVTVNDDKGNYAFTKKVVSDKSAATVVVEEISSMGSAKNFLKIHKDPTSLEIWKEAGGQRFADDGVMESMQEVVEQVLAYSSSWFW